MSFSEKEVKAIREMLAERESQKNPKELDWYKDKKGNMLGIEKGKTPTTEATRVE